MASTREPPTIGDYVVTALSPILIMGLVGSLAYFLLDILYAGQHIGRMRWMLLFFVVGAVLIGRISIQIDRTRAWLYGAALGGAVFLAMLKYVQYPEGSSLAVAGPIFNLLIIAAVLWSANKLTWDCTYVDETVEDAGGGLLEDIRDDLAGVDREQSVIGAETPPTSDAPGKRRTAKPMGRWVVFFSLAALPLFGLGQALIPADATGRRNYAFWLMTIYVGCGLGLLLTTTLLGLRRYLRRRKLKMPMAMTGLWIGSGFAMIVAFLAIAAIMPLSHPEFSLLPIKPLGSAEREASRHAPKSDSAGKGEGRGGAQGDDKNASDGSGGKGQEGGKAKGRTGKPEGPGGEKAGDRGKGGDDSKGGDGGQKSNDSETSNDNSSSSPPSSSKLGAVANVLKWIVLIAIGVLLLLGVIWFLARNLAGTFDWARKLCESLSAFWRSLFGGEAPERDLVEDAEVVQDQPPPFSVYSNPFTDGSAQRKSADALVRYSFAALEAWAFEQALARRTDETPFEFAERVGIAEPPLASESNTLAGLYGRLAYARQKLPPESRAQIERFWRVLQQVQIRHVPELARNVGHDSPP